MIIFQSFLNKFIVGSNEDEEKEEKKTVQTTLKGPTVVKFKMFTWCNKSK